jgi:hypothetical protein
MTMAEQERDRPTTGGPTESLGSAPGQDSFGNAPTNDGTGTFGNAPGQESVGNAPRSTGRNLPLLVGGGVAVLAVLAAIIGFLVK